MLKLGVEVVKCLKCGKDNRFLTQADIHEYGTWIAHNRKCDRFSRVMLIDNPIFDEFLEMIGQVCSDLNIEDKEKYLHPDITQALFPMACDPVDGDVISFRDEPRICRYCGSKEFAGTLSEPLHAAEVETFEVTYDLWNKKTKEEKKHLLSEAIRKYL